MCSTDPFETGLEFLRLIEDQASDSCLQWTGGPRGVFSCVKSWDDEGTLVLAEGLRDPRLVYGKDVSHELRVCPLDRDLVDAGSARVGLIVAAKPSLAPAAAAEILSSLAPPL